MKIIIFLFFVLGFACFVAYGVIGSKIDENNIIQEPFFLIPLGQFFMLVSVSFMAIDIISYVKAKTAILFLLCSTLFFGVFYYFNDQWILFNVLGIFSIVGLISSTLTVIFQKLRNYYQSKKSKS